MITTLKKTNKQNNSYTHELYNLPYSLDFLSLFVLLYGGLFDVAFEHVEERSSFCPEGGLQYSLLGTKRHSPGFVCNITGATKMLF